MVAAAAERGWTRFAPDPRIRAWAEAAHRAALAVVADPQMRAEWLQCEGTWFVGVDALPTAPDGSIDGTPLRGAVIEAVSEDSPAAKAGLKKGDIILSFGDTEVDDLRDLTRAVATTTPESAAEVVVLRKGSEQTLDVTVGALEPKPA